MQEGDPPRTDVDQFHPSPRRFVVPPVDIHLTSTSDEPIIHFMPQPPPQRDGHEQHMRPRIIDRRRPTTCEPKVETRRFRHFLRATGSTFAEPEDSLHTDGPAARLDEIADAASIRREIPAVTLFPPQGHDQPWRRVVSRTLLRDVSAGGAPPAGSASQLSSSSATTPSSEASITSLGALFNRGQQLRLLSEFPLRVEGSPQPVDAASSPAIPHDRAWRDGGARLAAELVPTGVDACTPSTQQQDGFHGNPRGHTKLPTRRRHSSQQPQAAASAHLDAAALARLTKKTKVIDEEHCDAGGGFADDDGSGGDDFELAVASVTSYTRKSSRRPASAL